MIVSVESIGPSRAKIFIVGEAPGEHEEAEGKPFVGGSGRLLNRLLMEAGMVREECRIGNVMNVRPPKNDFGHFYIDRQKRIPTQELIDSIARLKEEIRECNPNIVLALGNEALRALTGERGVTKWRGSILFSRDLGCKVIPTIHPAALLRSWNNVPLVMFDFKRVREESKSAEYSLRTRDFMLRPSFEKVMQELDRMEEEKKKLSFDVETDEDRHITALALSDSPWTSLSIPFTLSTGAPYWTIEEEEAIWLKVKVVMEDEEIAKVAQNAQFDILMFMINPYHIKVKGLVHDTMCAHHTIYPEMASSEEQLTGKHSIGGGKGLGLLCSIYTRQPYYKHWGKSGDDEMFWRYNCMDAAVTYEVADVEEREMKEFGVWDFYHRLVHPLIPILLDMQMRGVKIDQPLREQAYKEYEADTVKLQALLDGAVGHVVNVMSPKQLQILLYEDLGLPTKYKRGTTRVTTDEQALEELSAKYKSPVFELILKIRHNRKLMSTYLSDKGGEDGRIRCSYIIGGTETGRLSSRESVFGSGTNLQNIPKGVCRRMFVADEGRVFIEADLSQAEARVVAYLAEEERLIDLFNRGGDIHTQNAAWIYSKAVGDVTYEERELAKRLVHASNYGIGPRTFAHHAGVNEREAKRLLERYFDTFPRIRAWHMKVKAALSKSRTMKTPMGRKRTFFGMWGDSLFRQAYAFVPQSTVADVLNLALIRFVNLAAVHREDYQPMLQVHDAFAAQCREGEVGDCAGTIREAFNIPITIGGREFVIPVGMNVGKNWQDMEKIK